MGSRPAVIVCVVASLAAGCSSEQTQNGTAFRLTVLFDGSVAIDQVRVGPGPATGELLAPDPPASLTSGYQVMVPISDPWAESNVTVTVTGLASGKEVAHGQVSGTPHRGQIVDLRVTLTAPCTSKCAPGETRCEKAQIRLCTMDAEGCADFTAPQPCPTAKPVCSGDVCAASCSDSCPSGARRCRDAGYQVCGKSEAGCLDWGAVLGCASTEICSEGQCLLDCGGKPCSCQPGQTQACVDVGECKSGQRQCVNGAFGNCQWLVGPSAEVCDGKDNDCSGTVDDNLVAPPCAKQQGVCQGALQKCGGAAGWSECTSVDYQSFATSKGLTYEATESKCDGKDNDCNGKVDEPTSCCQPSCTGKACGADDGCGHSCSSGSCTGAQEQCISGKCVCQPSCTGKACGAADGCGGKCQTGSCSANASCQGGVCTCDVLTCGSSCCAPGQVCKATACCTPGCGGRQCGPDPVCGASCGTCTSGICDAQGKCQTACVPEGPITIDTSGMCTSLAVDAAGKVHISYFNDTNKTLKYATNVAGSWQTSSVDSSAGPLGTAMALDKSNNVHISYCNRLNIDLKYATKDVVSGSWQTSTVDTTGVGQYSSLAVDAGGKVHISYYDLLNADLKYATGVSGSWQTFTVDSAGSVGNDTSLDVDAAGNVHVSYYDSTNQNLKYAMKNVVSGSWQTFTVDSVGNVGASTSLALDAASKVHISYRDLANSDLKYATNGAGAWLTTTACSTGTVTSTSLALDTNGKAHISFCDVYNNDLMYTTNMSGVWQTSTVDATGAAGEYNSIAIDPTGKVHLSYSGSGGLKYVALCPK